MKKILVALCFVFLFSTVASAEIYDVVTEETVGEEEIFIPDESIENAEFFGEEPSLENAATFFDIKTVFSFLLKVLTDVFSEEKGAFVSLLSILLVSFLSRQLGSGLSSSKTLFAVERTVVIFSALAAFLPLFSSAEEAAALSEDLSSCALSLLPVFSAVSPSAATAATTYSVSSLIFFSTELFSWVFSSLVPVLCSVFLAASLAGGISGDNGVKKISATVRNVTVAVVTAFCFLITALPSLQSGIFSSGESYAKKGLKFVVSSVLPVGGGFLSDGLESVFSAVDVVKKGCGSFFAVITLLCAAAPVLRLAVCCLVFRLSQGVAAAFGNEGLENFLSSSFDACAVVLSFTVAVSVVLCELMTILSNVGGSYG